MRTIENLLASWSLVQEGGINLSNTEGGEPRWEINLTKNDLVVTIHDLDAIIGLIEEVLDASEPIKESILHLATMYGYNPEGLVLSNLSISNLTKFTWIGDALAEKEKRLEIRLNDKILLAAGRDTKPGLLGLAGVKNMEAPNKAKLLDVMKKLHPLIKKLR